MRHKRKGRMMVVGSEDLLWDMFGKWSNKMNDSVSNEQTELLADIESKMSEAELRFARGKDGKINYRYALEVAIDLMANRQVQWFPEGKRFVSPSKRAA
jgi:hypothetical protein